MKNKLLFLTLLALLPVCSITYTMENDDEDTTYRIIDSMNESMEIMLNTNKRKHSENSLPMPDSNAIVNTNLSYDNTVNADDEFGADIYTNAQKAFSEQEFQGFAATLMAQFAGAEHPYAENERNEFYNMHNKNLQKFPSQKAQLRLKKIKRQTEDDIGNGNVQEQNSYTDTKRTPF